MVPVVFTYVDAFRRKAAALALWIALRKSLQQARFRVISPGVFVRSNPVGSVKLTGVDYLCDSSVVILIG